MSTDRAENPARTTTTTSSKRLLAIRSENDGESQGSIIAAGVIFSLVVVATIVGLAIVYFRDPQNFLKRRQKKKTGRDSTSSTEPLSEDYLKRSSSLISDRESIMFSRSRSSSLQFAVVESEKPPPLPKVLYAPLEQIDTSYNAGNIVMTDPHQHDPHVSEKGTNTSTIPVVITPPPDTPTSQPQTTVARPADLKASAPSQNPPTEKQQSSSREEVSTQSTTSASHADDESSALLPRS
ncbi:hypothetical protein VTN96DRAFT_8674 [Rasamsonia emersonii]